MTRFGRLSESTKRDIVKVISNNIGKTNNEISHILNRKNPSVCLDITQVSWIKRYIRRVTNAGKSIKY